MAQELLNGQGLTDQRENLAFLLLLILGGVGGRSVLHNRHGVSFVISVYEFIKIRAFGLFDSLK